MEYTLDALDTDKASDILSMHFGYYKKLDEEEKQRFVARVMQFIEKKDFIPRENVDVSAGLNNIKVLIAASAIQLTFGLEKYLLDHFSKIFIYPTEYYNNMTKHWHKGETNPMGAIVFSWKDLQAGNENADDGINLGLHEMAHALMLGRKLSETADEFFAAYLDKWWAISNSEFLKLEAHQSTMFRDYGGTNPQEFFAVCVECFFEIPDKFKEQHAEIYKQTCILLNQDPSANNEKLIQGRKSMLSLIPASIEPTNLNLVVGDKNGITFQAVGYIFMFLIGLFLFVSGITGGIIQITFMGLIFVVSMLLLMLRANVGVFYFYDNALVIGSRSMLSGQKRRITFVPEELVRVQLEIEVHSKGPDDYYLNVYYVDDAKIVKERYLYTELNESKRAILEKMTQDFCLKHQIGFVKEY